jgi:hypothetical protein
MDVVQSFASAKDIKPPVQQLTPRSSDDEDFGNLLIRGFWAHRTDMMIVNV